MQIIHHLSIDLARQLPVPPVGAVQGDANARAVEISLLENGGAWEVPAGITAAVAFRKPDKTRGLYDTLPDKTKAVTIDGSTVTAILAPQVLSCAGEVSAAVVFYDSNLNQLATFPFAIRVANNPAAGQQVSNDYYQYSTMEEVSAAVEAALASMEDSKQDFLAKAEEALNVVHDTATEDAPAIICEATGEIITVADSANRPLSGLSLYGKTTQDGTPTPENPVPLVSVGAGGAINTTVGGKNLFDASPDGSQCIGNYYVNTAQYKFSITPYESSYCYRIKVESGKKHVLSTSATSMNMNVRFEDIDKKFVSGLNWQNMKGVAFTVPNQVEYIVFSLSTSAVSNHTYQLELGNTATEYEPYKGQTLTASTPNGLPGIPVSGGGNYTDENGQQWICDEIDFARGMYVQRIGQLDSYAGEEIPGGYMSTTGELSEGAAVLYALTEAAETVLSAEELAAYAALHSNKPNTTVFNNSGAGMKLSYVADTKTYIDNKLAAISAAILS